MPERFLPLRRWSPVSWEAACHAAQTADDDPRLACQSVRRSAEGIAAHALLALVDDFKLRGMNFAKMLDELQARSLIDDHLYRKLKDIRKFGNNAAHGLKSPNQFQARQAVKALSAFSVWLVTLLDNSQPNTSCDEHKTGHSNSNFKNLTNFTLDGLMVSCSDGFSWKGVHILCTYASNLPEIAKCFSSIHDCSKLSALHFPYYSAEDIGSGLFDVLVLRDRNGHSCVLLKYGARHVLAPKMAFVVAALRFTEARLKGADLSSMDWDLYKGEVSSQCPTWHFDPLTGACSDFPLDLKTDASIGNNSELTLDSIRRCVREGFALSDTGKAYRLVQETYWQWLEAVMADGEAIRGYVSSERPEHFSVSIGPLEAVVPASEFGFDGRIQRTDHYDQKYPYGEEKVYTYGEEVDVRIVKLDKAASYVEVTLHEEYMAWEIVTDDEL